MIEIINTGDNSWRTRLDTILDRVRKTPEDVDNTVRQIIDQVKERRDQALIDYTKTLDGFDCSIEGMLITAEDIEKAYSRVDKTIISTLEAAADRIKRFHSRQREDSWIMTERDGSILGQKVTPIDNVGVYIPGGKNAFPSTMLMNVIPAKIAGVDNIVVVSPTPGGRVNDILLASARIAGIERIYRIGGAQAVAALAYGTETIPRVDKVVGPGNIYVAYAKRLLQGRIGIDAIAGPSEILVIADKSADAAMTASDLLSQAEHDVLASSILVTTDEDFAHSVLEKISKEVPDLPRKDIITLSLKNHGACIITKDLDEAVEIANYVAPEHLELMVDNAYGLLGRIKNAGAIFLGHYSPEAIGDYIAGPNHTLPTGSTARFYSPLGVYDFVKRSSIIGLSHEAAKGLGPMAARFARAEDLEAHARSVESRIRK